MIGVYLTASDGGIDYVEFRTVMSHLPPSIFYVTLKSAEERSNAAHSIFFITPVPQIGLSNTAAT